MPPYNGIHSLHNLFVVGWFRDWQFADMGNNLSIAELNAGVEQQNFTREELRRFDGRAGRAPYVAIMRKVNGSVNGSFDQVFSLSRTS